jgi:Transglycosylase-like domain.
MNGRALAIGSSLLVAVTSTAVIGSVSAAAGGASDRARSAAPSRAEARKHQLATPPVDLPSVDPAVKAHNDAVVVTRFIAAVNTVRWVEAVAANERARAAQPRRSSSAYSGDILECIKHRESDGLYNVVNGSSGAAGAYQFMPGTWDNNARAAGRTDLVGVNPANASPADQDAMAHHLLATQGLGPWGGGCG